MEGTKPGKKRTTALIIVLILIVFLLLALVLWLMLGRDRAAVGSSGGSGGVRISFDETAQSGHLPGKSEEEIQAELNKIVEEGMFNISIAANISFPDGGKKGKANIENIEANHYNMQVSITLDETGELVYESGALKPGQYIESITLLRDLPAGTYNATATFAALNRKTMEPVGRAAAKIALVIES